MKHKLTFKAALWWVIALAMLGAALMIFGKKEEHPSLSENRMMAGFPALTAESVLSGDFMTGFEDYLSDNFFGRDELVALSENALGVFSAEDEESRLSQDVGESIESEFEGRGVSDGTTPVPQAEATPEPETRPTAAPTAAPRYGERLSVGAAPADTRDDSYVPLNKYNFWMVKNDQSLVEVYNYEPDTIVTLMKGLNAIRATLPEDGGVHFALIPVAQSANRWTRQTETFCGWRSNAEEYMAALADEGVYIYNAPDILAEGISRGEYLYYRTDHHWTPRGAYAVFSAMMERQGLPVTNFDDYTYKVNRGYLGSIYQENHSQALRNNPDDIEIPSSLAPVHSYVIKRLTSQTEVSYMADYSNYLAYLQGTLTPWRRILGGADNPRKCLVICDSFGNCFAPYLLPYYSEVHMVDLRQGNFSVEEAGGAMADFIDYYGIQDVYVILSAASGLNYNYTQQYLLRYLGK